MARLGGAKGGPREKKKEKSAKWPWQFSLRSTAAFPQQLTGQMVRKQLRRTKPPAVPQGQPGSPAPGRFPVLFRGDGRKGFAPGLRSLRRTRYREEKSRRGGEEPPQGNGQLFEGGGSANLPALEAKTRPARKNARNAVAGDRGAAQQGAPVAPHPPPQCSPTGGPHTGRASRCGERSGPFLLSLGYCEVLLGCLTSKSDKPPSLSLATSFPRPGFASTRHAPLAESRMMCEQKVVILCSRDQQEQTRFCLVSPQYNTSASLRPGKAGLAAFQESGVEAAGEKIQLAPQICNPILFRSFTDCVLTPEHRFPPQRSPSFTPLWSSRG